MNMQKLMQEAQKMQKQLQKDQEELENTIYEGKSSNVVVKLNGKYEVISFKFNIDDNLDNDDIEMLEDMAVVAFNDAVKKISADKEKKMGKYGHGLSGLM